jgi:hypothetical protein
MTPLSAPPASAPLGSAEHRTAQLLRWYPRSWRARYGAEFTELLLAELAEQPRSWRRAADIAANGLLARCTSAGLTSHELPPVERIRCGVATLCCALATFLTFGVAMLAQLATGWQWVRPGSTSATSGSIAMAAAMVCLALIGVLAGVAVGWRAAVTAVRFRDGKLARSGALVLAAGTTLVSGTLHVQNSWPGTGGTGALHSLVPGGIAAFGWASTLSVSTFWAHPALLGILPGAELAWMVVSPFAVLGLVAGLVALLRRLAMPGWLLTYLAWLALAASAVAAVFLAGAASWVLGNGSGQAELFRPGLINGAELAIMALALTVALRAAIGIWHGLAAGVARF